jgi:hypothetical protein
VAPTGPAAARIEASGTRLCDFASRRLLWNSHLLGNEILESKVVKMARRHGMCQWNVLPNYLDIRTLAIAVQARCACLRFDLLYVGRGTDSCHIGGYSYDGCLKREVVA